MMTGSRSKTGKDSTETLFCPGGVLFGLLLFFGAIAALNGAAWQLCQPLGLADCPRFWPISIFTPRNSWTWEYLPALAALLLGFLGLRSLREGPKGLTFLFLSGLVLISLSNAAQGFGAVLTQPVAGSWNQYYHDALRVTRAFDFLAYFNFDQQGLLTHSRTHPPGAVLFVYGLLKIVPQPWFTALSFAFLGTGLSTFFLYKILSTEFDRELSAYGTFLFLLLPAVQIYYLASLDAVIAGLSLAALYFFIHPRRGVGLTGAAVFLFCVSFLTFGFLFFLPVFAGCEWVKKRNFYQTAALVSVLCALYAAGYFLTGFNYLEAFHTASLLENPDGFRLAAEPLDYFLTRLECIFEILLFSGPFFVLAVIEGFSKNLQRPSGLILLSVFACGTLAAMLLLGVYETGESARVCLYFYPFLIFPVLKLMQNSFSWARVRYKLAGIVFFQAVIMQVIGNYFW